MRSGIRPSIVDNDEEDSASAYFYRFMTQYTAEGCATPMTIPASRRSSKSTERLPNGPLAILTPIEVELVGKPPEALALLDEFLAGNIGTMEFASGIEGVRKKCATSLAHQEYILQISIVENLSLEGTRGWKF
jgi:hypothetical protein